MIYLMLFISLLYQEFEPKRLTYEHSGNVKTSNTVCITDNDYLQVNIVHIIS